MGDFSKTAHRAVIKVPDERVDGLAKLANPKKITYAEIEFLDAPGFSGKGKEAGSVEISPDLRLMEALMPVVDCFSSDANPKADIRDLLDEMILADQVVVENNIEKKSRKIKLTGDKAGAREIELLEKCRVALDDGKLLIDLDMPEDEEKILRGYTFLTLKPLLFVLNIDEASIAETENIRQQMAEYIVPGKRDVAILCGKIEMELGVLDDDERQMLMEELGIVSPAVEKVIQKSYSLLGMISFLTLGDPEVRAWTIKKGTKAVKAAGAIHTDIERGFIRAEVAAYDDYIKYETLPALKSAGKSHLEGKDYVVQDGDVILFRFNV